MTLYLFISPLVSSGGTAAQSHVTPDTDADEMLWGGGSPEGSTTADPHKNDGQPRVSEDGGGNVAPAS